MGYAQTQVMEAMDVEKLYPEKQLVLVQDHPAVIPSIAWTG